MATARDLIESSLRLIGVLATGETATAEEATDALDVLNDMMDSWATEGAFVHAVVREEFTLVSGTAAYTIGPSATFNTTRPIEIDAAAIEVQGSEPQEVPIEVVTSKQWAAIELKNIQGAVPSKLYAEGTFPQDTLNLWPVPNEANKLVLYSQKTLTRFAALSTSVSLPPGYSKALRYGLALELAPEYQRPADALVVAGAAESKANIQRKNLHPQYLDPQLPASVLRRGFDWRTGE